MAMFTPNSEVQLFSGVPLNPSYTDTIDFASTSAQELYFLGFRTHTYGQLTYIRERSVIAVPEEYDNLIGTNYLRYRNSNFGNKWFYAFVTAVNYVNPNMTELVVQQDVMQTWLFDYHVVSAFIEREHTKSDWPFEHNIPEGLEFGPTKTGYSEEKSLSEMVIVLAYSPANINKDEKGAMHAGVYSGVAYKYFETTDAGVETLNQFIEAYATGGFLDDILSIFMIPKAVARGFAINYRMDTYPVAVDGYIPRNNKLFSYPYRYLAIDNHTGQEAIYRFDLFRNPSAIWLNVASIYNMDSACWLYPMDYAGQENNWDEGISLSNFPQCTWNGNIYANWLSRNKLSLGMQNIQMGVGLVTGITSGAMQGAMQGAVAGGPVGAAIGGLGGALTGGLNPLLSIGDTLAQRGDKSLYPNKLAGQENNSTVNVAWNKVGFIIKIMVITKEYAKILDDYFDRYGYKVSRTGVPDTKTRRSWNYVKTVDCKIKGPFPADQCIAIQNIYNNGITFWHVDDVGNYTLPNDCVNPGAHPVWEPPTNPPPPPHWEPSKPQPTGWGYPAVGWSNYRVTSGYGWRWINGERRWHDGVDIAIPNNWPLLAAHEGRITYIGKNELRGNYIDVTFVMDDGREAFYRYQHCNAIIGTVGDNVEVEKQIATCGWTGNVIPPGVQGAHLHMELHLEDIKGSGTFHTVDPLPYLVPNYETRGGN